jgi:hypothetical protein
MPYVVVRHQVDNYEKWKVAFDAQRDARRASGSRGGHVCRSIDEPSELVIVLEWDDLERARRFVDYTDLRNTMRRAGGLEEPTISYLETIERTSA